MSEILARCTNVHCGAVFTTPSLFELGPGVSITIGGFSTICPKCKSSAIILEGTYTGSVGEGPVFQSGPFDTASAVAALRRVIADAKAGKDAEDIIKDLELRSPKLGSVARGIVARKGLVFLITALSYILAACDAKLEMKLDWNVMADQLYHYATGKDPYPGLTGAPKPEAETPSEKPEGAKQSEPEQTSSLKPQPSHHKSHPSKRRKRRNARLCAPKQK